MRLLAPYYGGKASKVDDILPFLPHTKFYCEPFFGMGSIFFNKEPVSTSNVINDIDDHIYNLFKVIRDNHEELSERLQWTSNSRSEFYACNDYLRLPREEREPVEWARCALAFICMGYRHALADNKSYSYEWHSPNSRITNAMLRVAEIGRLMRMRDVVIENLPADEMCRRLVIKDDYLDGLIYMDPPYVMNTRVTGQVYNHDFMSDEEHEKLLNVVLNTKIKVCISGYPSELYDDILKDWNRHEFETLAHASNTLGPKQKRMEVLWFNYDPPQKYQHSIF